HVSGLDDAVFATARKGTFYLADTGNNRILKIEVDHVPVGALFASIGSLKELAVVDIHTGLTTPLVSNLNGPHGLEFVPDDDDNDNEQWASGDFGPLNTAGSISRTFHIRDIRCRLCSYIRSWPSTGACRGRHF